MYNIEGYTTIASSLVKRGICLYCKPDIKYNILTDNSDFDEYLLCEFTGNHESFLLGVCYRSPNSTVENDSKMLNLFNNMSKIKTDNMVIVGD